MSLTPDTGTGAGTGPDAGGPPHPSWRFARYLAGYRGNLTRSEAARRSGLPEVLWERIESIQASEPHTDLIPPSIVATMCVAVGANVSTGLSLAGHQPDMYRHLIERPPVFTPLTRGTTTFSGPYIATPHIVSAALAVDSAEAHARMASVYRRLAQSNWQVSNRIVENPPDSRVEYWAGYAAAIRAVAEQQAWAADQENLRQGTS